MIRRIVATLALTLGLAAVPTAAFADGCGFSGGCDPNYPQEAPAVIQHEGTYTEAEAQANFAEYLRVWNLVDAAQKETEEVEEVLAAERVARIQERADLVAQVQERNVRIDALEDEAHWLKFRLLKKTNKIAELRDVIRDLRSR